MKQAIFFAFILITSALVVHAQTAAPKFELKSTGFVGPDSTKTMQ